MTNVQHFLCSEMSQLKCWGLITRTQILSRGVLFFACFLKKIFFKMSFFSAHTVEGKGWVLFFKPQKPQKATFPPPSLFTTTPTYCTTHYPTQLPIKLDWGTKQGLKARGGWWVVGSGDHNQWQPLSSAGGRDGNHTQNQFSLILCLFL